MTPQEISKLLNWVGSLFQASFETSFEHDTGINPDHAVLETTGILLTIQLPMSAISLAISVHDIQPDNWSELGNQEP